MVNAAREAGVTLGVAHVMRFEESVQADSRSDCRWRDWPAAAGASRLSCSSAWQHRAGGSTIPLLPREGRWPMSACIASTHCDSFWAMKWSRFRRELTMTSIGWSRRREQCCWSSQGGVLATVSVSARSPYRTFLEVAGETGVLSSVNGLSVEQPPTVELRRAFEVIESREVSNANAYAAQVDAFAAAIEEGRDFEIPGRRRFAQSASS